MIKPRGVFLSVGPSSPRMGCMVNPGEWVSV